MPICALKVTPQNEAGSRPHVIRMRPRVPLPTVNTGVGLATKGHPRATAHDDRLVVFGDVIDSEARLPVRPPPGKPGSGGGPEAYPTHRMRGGRRCPPRIPEAAPMTRHDDRTARMVSRVLFAIHGAAGVAALAGLFVERLA